MTGTRLRNAGTPPLSRDELLDAPVFRLIDCSLSMECYEGCTKPGQLELKTVTEISGPRLQLLRFLARLRCKGCRRRPASVVIFDSPTHDALPTWRVVLLP
jgi:hypothetical protein